MKRNEEILNILEELTEHKEETARLLKKLSELYKEQYIEMADLISNGYRLRVYKGEY